VKDGGWEVMSWAEYSVFSPDGETIAFVWFTASGGLSGEDGKYLGYSIKTIPVTGGEPLDLVPAGAFHYAVLDDWSADGEYLLARLWKPEGEFCLCRIRTSDGSRKGNSVCAGSGRRTVQSLRFRGPQSWAKGFSASETRSLPTAITWRSIHLVLPTIATCTS